MLRVLVVTHRWLGIVLAPLFAMWLASGIVMHFVPFPQLSESERLKGLPPLRLEGSLHAPADAVIALAISDALRVRLIQRAHGPVYLVSGTSGSAALQAGDLAPAGVTSSPLALAIGAEYARQRGIKAPDSGKIALIDHDQWTVAGDYHPYRPLYRLALDDDAGTEVYPREQARSCLTPRAESAAEISRAASRIGSTPRLCAAGPRYGRRSCSGYRLPLSLACSQARFSVWRGCAAPAGSAYRPIAACIGGIMCLAC
jgi:hypothetical protein